MADDQRNDPPWGRPLEPEDMERPGGADEVTDQEQAAADTGADAPAEATPVEEQPGPDFSAEPSETAHDAPPWEAEEQAPPDRGGGLAGGTGEHVGADVVDEPIPPGASYNPDEFPMNVLDATREGEHPYQWHSGQRPRPEGSEDAVEFIDVKKAFGRNVILNGLNLGLPDNEISMILGPSGTGKSVCIKHMIGLLYPDEGDVLVHGESVPNMVDDELFEMRKKFGVLFQDGALFGSMNVFDNTAFPLRQHTDKSEEEIADIVNSRLNEVGLTIAADKMPNELSGGMRKRAGFARALVMNPSIVLFDEPDSGLDPVRTALLCELIQEIHAEQGGCYCVITHDIMSARRVADYIAVVWKGRIVESGPASELFNSDNQFVRQFLSGEAVGPLGME